MTDRQDAKLYKTPLYAWHVGQGARMCPFAGFEMPVQYYGIVKEHAHTRTQASLFDVSHMVQAVIMGDSFESVARWLEMLVPSDILGLIPGQSRYTVLLNEQGGIVDDLIVTRSQDPTFQGLMLVMNAARLEADMMHIKSFCPREIQIVHEQNRALLALQGPLSAQILSHHAKEAGTLMFMQAHDNAYFDGLPVRISRSGYTGEDGFEISCLAEDIEKIADALCAHARVLPAGLGARDSLRLEAGLCLYGHDIDETISPVGASLGWVIAKRRREDGGFLGAGRVLDELANSACDVRVGFSLEGRIPAREGAEIVVLDQGDVVGRVTSGTFSPTLEYPIGMARVKASVVSDRCALGVKVRDKVFDISLCRMPFVPHRVLR